MTDINGKIRIFLSQKQLSDYDLHEQGAIKATNQSESGDCELGYPEDWSGDEHVWVDAAKQLGSLALEFGDMCSANGYEDAAAYLGEMDYIIESVSKFMDTTRGRSPFLTSLMDEVFPTRSEAKQRIEDLDQSVSFKSSLFVQARGYRLMCEGAS